MLNIVGIVITATGFLAPYLTNGRIPAIPLFWIGGLVFLNKGIFIKPETTWKRWARIGIIANIAFFALMLGTFSVTVNRTTTAFVHWLSMIPYWLSRPATALGQQIFPFPEIRHPDGSVTSHMGFTRTVIADFLDIAIFVAVAVAIGLLWNRKQKGKAKGVKSLINT